MKRKVLAAKYEREKKTEARKQRERKSDRLLETSQISRNGGVGEIDNHQIGWRVKF